MPPKLSKKQMSSAAGTGASSAGKAAATSPKLANFHPISGFAAPAPKPKAARKPSTHPVQRR